METVGVSRGPNGWDLSGSQRDVPWVLAPVGIGISLICSTSRDASALSVFVIARYREYDPRNINGRTPDIGPR